MPSALVIIDMQVDFFANRELARCQDDLVRACNLLVDTARDDDQGMVLAGTPGAQPVPGLREADVLVEKTRDSAFHETGLTDVLRERGVDRLVLCGVSTESCIAATAAAAYAADLRVTLVEDATVSVEQSQHGQTLEVLHVQYRQPVVAAREVSFIQESERVASCPRRHFQGGPETP